MKIFITSTNTDIGKTYVTKNLFKLFESKGYKICIFKPFQTEEIKDGVYPDLEVYKKECHLDYNLTSLFKFKEPVSPHLGFKMECKNFNRQKVFDYIYELEENFDFILIEGAGGLAVPIYESDYKSYMTADLIRDISDIVISVLPSKIGAISDSIVHQFYFEGMNLPPNVLLMNQYTDSYIERDNKKTISKLTNKKIYTFKENGNYYDFSDEFITLLLGGK